jgi:hypothetical protein
MALTTFNPELWTSALLSPFEKALVYGFLTNRDYEGEISAYGDRVRINTISDPTISNYTKSTDMSAPEDLQSADQVLVIDQAKSFNFFVDSIDQAQNRAPVLAKATQRAGYKLRDVVDQFIAGLYTGVASGNTIGSDGSPITPTANTAGTAAYEYIVDMNTKLTQANAPQEGRWVVLTPAYYALLQKDNRFVANGTPGNMDVLTNGRVGRAAGMDIYVSNNAPKVSSNWKIIAGLNDAISFAAQITEMDAYKPEKRFGDALKGLMVYGAKLVRPDAIVVTTSTI